MKQKVNEDLSDHSDGDIDDLDLRLDEPDPGATGDENEDETSAEKRLHLAQLYLDSVNDSRCVLSPYHKYRSLAHGFNEVHSSTEGLIQTPRWTTALTALCYSDLFISGHIRLRKLDNKLKLSSLVGEIPIPGVVNSLQIISPPKSFFTPQAAAAAAGASWLSSSMTTLPADAHPALVIVGVGQEHRFDRWLSVKEGGAVNGPHVIGLLPNSDLTLSPRTIRRWTPAPQFNVMLLPCYRAPDLRYNPLLLKFLTQAVWYTSYLLTIY
ncbi:hypothetical protein P691DRAFT_126714 [Macrolepiota fuliginosa MF-IS2]|uniref:Uncharacterized protein n=1 Tax=Macrolepiota fuliginosa MF-IS2 TaxID=1400762 RepID=A0A9P5WWN0_9AGAR|nr:hypothetical protein P691DRAFT_126714 [Macrolepiota fuliginosa MF-IS2]